MKQAEVLVSLTPNHQVHRKNVTPIEALFLVAEHFTSSKGSPLQVVAGTETETGHVVAKVSKKKVVNKVSGKDAAGKVVEVDVESEVETTEQVVEPDNRTEDQEIARLKGKYDGKKIKTILTEVRNLPKTFDEAIKLGASLKLGGDGLLTKYDITKQQEV